MKFQPIFDHEVANLNLILPQLGQVTVSRLALQRLNKYQKEQQEQASDYQQVSSQQHMRDITNNTSENRRTTAKKFQANNI